MKSAVENTRKRVVSFAAAALIAGITTSAASAAQWMAVAGAQSPDLGSQALAFLPNELWIHAGDSIRWTHASTEIHTVTFLKPGQVRPPNFGPTFGIPVGCPGSTLDGADFDGTLCVNSGVLGQGPVNLGPVIQTFTVTFPTAGNFKLVCLVHTDMTGTVHVLQSADPTKAFYAASLPYIQRDYARQGSDEASDILNDGDNQSEEVRELPANNVIAGIGEIVATGG